MTKENIDNLNSSGYVTVEDLDENILPDQIISIIKTPSKDHTKMVTIVEH